MAKTLTTELAELEQEHAANVAKLKLEHNIREQLPEGLRDSVRVHVYPIYGSIGSIHADYNFFDYTKKAKQPTLDTIAELAEALPPIPLVEVSDGCRSFRPATYVESMPADKRERINSETPVCPFTVDIDHNQGNAVAEFNWYAKLASGELVGVRVILPLYTLAKLGKLSVKFTGNNRGDKYAHSEFSPNHNAIGQLFDAEGNQLAQLGQCIKWAAGSREYPNHFTMYWVNYRENATTTIADLLRQLA